MVNQSSSNNKRIFKNTIILYIRMLFVMLITLYSSRLVLKALGVEDFGLYNVVGGVVGLLSFFNVTMSRSTQRFLSIAMVKSEESLNEIFASSITVHLIIASVFFILGETMGLWFLNTHIHIPVGREFASNIVYQASLISLCFSIITIPYSSAIIAHEKMTFIAIVSIIDSILKLSVAFFLLTSTSDRLILYSILLLIIVILNFFLYFTFCRIQYKVLEFRLSFNKDNFKQLFGFVSWTLLGESAQIGCNQGNAILVNLFHPLSANAAMTIGSQVNNAISSLTANFQIAFTPQITKSYAEENYEYLKKLVYTTSKISFCILVLVALPISFNIDWILSIWLEEVPLLSNIFSVLFLINAVLNAISSPFHFVVLASGKIRNFQILSSIVYLLDLPLTYALFAVGLSAPTVLWVKICTMIVIVIIRIIYASKVVPTINAFEYCRKELLPLLFATSIPILCAIVLNSFSSLLLRLIYTMIIELFYIIILWIICLKKEERTILLSFLKIKK